MMEILKTKKNRKSTMNNHHCVWTQFNKFLIRLDVMPSMWEDRVALYVTYLVNEGYQSSTVKSYISAIKCVLKDDGYEWDDGSVLLSSLTRACRLINDKVRTRLPIKCNLLELVLFEVQRIYHDQYFLMILYQSILLI